MPILVHQSPPHHVKPVVIDNGSGMIKAGFSSNDSPRAIFPTIVGFTKHAQQSSTMPSPYHHEPNALVGSYFVGELAMLRRNCLDIKSPMENGILSNFEDMEKIWNHIYKEHLQIKPEDQPVLLTEPNLNPKIVREKTTEIFFEKFKVPSFYLAKQAVMGLTACGRCDGVALESGYTSTFAVPVLEGYALPHAIQVLNFSGNTLTDSMCNLLGKRGLEVEREIARDIKERKCHVVDSFEQIKKRQETKNYELPDGTSIELCEELALCPEALFNPTLIGEEGEGIHKLVFHSIFNCNSEIRKQLYANIVPVGGSTLFEGLSSRLYKELVKVAPLSTKVKVYTPPERKFSSWIGGSIVSSLSEFKNIAISKKEYEEVGPRVVMQKCF